MISLFRLAYRNALRNGRRTLLTAATVTIGTAFVVVTLSFMAGIFDGMTEGWVEVNGPVRVVTTAYAEREQLRPLHENIAESDPVVATLTRLDAVGAAYPIIRTGVGVSVGEELGEDGAMLTGAPKAFYDAHVLPGIAFAGGHWLDDASEDEQVVLGSRVARDVGAKVGDEVLLLGTTQYGSMAPISADVVGVVTGNSAVEGQAFVTLDVARWMVDLPEGTLEIILFPQGEASDRAAASAIAASARQALGPDYSVTPWMEAAIWVQMLPITDGMSTIVSMILIFVMALAIFNTMTMSVLERTGEIGVMRAMGQTRLGAVGSFLAEALMIGATGGLIGVIVGAVPALYLQTNGMTFGAEILEDMGDDYVMTTVMYGELSVETVAVALVVGLVTALLGAFFPSLRAARIPPSEAMRQR
ncbi:MAG: putative ABC transport system permease protein [Myxococcota bacterium]|jgi:putative ABC transport system permease protein